jgi:hypothetical protein
MKGSDMRKMLVVATAAVLAVAGIAFPGPGWGAPFAFSTGNVNGLIATASRPANAGLGQIQIETADDFVLALPATITGASFIGLIPAAASLATIQQIDIVIYRVFSLDSTLPVSGHVPTRVNSPSDVPYAVRSSASGQLNFAPSILSPSYQASNSVINGIHPIPTQTTTGEGAVAGQEVQFGITLTTPISLPPGHYFFVPRVGLSSGTFLWLSASKPIVAPGTPFTGDSQSWIRDANLSPDWLRIGTDIVGGANPPQFNAAFSLSGTVSTIDIDGNGAYDALTDGLMIIRTLFGLTGASLTSGAVGSGATRTDSTTIASYLATLQPALDVDGNGQVDALTDGLMILRYLFGVRGSALIAGALGTGATRTLATDIETFIRALMP